MSNNIYPYVHGETNTKLYNVWRGMKRRCTEKTNSGYANYGGRGIKICKEWENDYISFRDWALCNGYIESKLSRNNISIDRIDNDGNYEPCNCRWVTNTIQHRNTRRIMSTNKSGFRGVDFYKKKWRASITVSGKHIHIGTFDSAECAAKARDNYIVKNNLEHTLNFNIKDISHG